MSYISLNALVKYFYCERTKNKYSELIFGHNLNIFFLAIYRRCMIIN